MTAHGQVLGENHELRLRERELAPLLEEFKQLPSSVRQRELQLEMNPTPPERPVPAPPEEGMILRGYCSYLDRDETGKLFRPELFYYRENPDRWRAETQSDMLWLTESEWKSLVPRTFTRGERVEVPDSIQQRFFCTIGIDYMEGSVNSLPRRTSRMELTLTAVDGAMVHMQLDGYAHLGVAWDTALREQPNSRGSEVRVLGQWSYDRQRKAFTRCDIVGVGEAWGNKMDYVTREVRNDDYPWIYGIACELVTTREPIDLIPPYNLLHYHSLQSYFAE